MRKPPKAKLSLRDAQMSVMSQAPHGFVNAESKFPIDWLDKTPRAAPTKPRQHQEHDEQSTYVKYLRQCCPDVLIEAGLTGELWGMARHIPKGIFYGWIGKLKARGMLTGGSDLKIYFAPARMVVLECKHGKGTENTAQEDVRKNLTAKGFKCYVIKSLDDLKEVIRIENIPCRDSSINPLSSQAALDHEDFFREV